VEGVNHHQLPCQHGKQVVQDDPDGCASHYANGDDAPGGCKIDSFTTVDVSFRWKANQKMEVFVRS